MDGGLQPSIARCTYLLFRCNVHRQNRVTPTRVFVHVVLAHGPIPHTLLKDGQQIVKLLAFDHEQVFHEETARLFAPANGKRLALSTRIQKVDHLSDGDEKI